MIILYLTDSATSQALPPNDTLLFVADGWDFDASGSGDEMSQKIVDILANLKNSESSEGIQSIAELTAYNKNQTNAIKIEYI